MEPNYFHTKFKQGENVSFQTPSAEGREIIPIDDLKVIKMTYANGHEMLQVSHEGEINIYASFPIILERY